MRTRYQEPFAKGSLSKGQIQNKAATPDMSLMALCANLRAFKKQKIERRVTA